MMTKFELFEGEQKVILAVEEAMKNPCLTLEDATELLSGLLGEYCKLLRQTKLLVKLGDGNASKLHHRNNELKRQSKNLEYHATHDALTGLLNKGEITRIIQRQLVSNDFVLVAFDIDHFKKVNDTHGHLVGDKVLSELAKLVQHNIKHKDFIGRFGGEEFIIVLNDTLHNEAVLLANSLLRLIGNTVLIEEGDLRVVVTVSMGVTVVKQNESFEDAFGRVDKLLYSAKRNGRNRVETEQA